MKNKYLSLTLLITGILAIFSIRALLAVRFAVPSTFRLFDILVVTGALLVLLKNLPRLRLGDWAAALDALQPGIVEEVMDRFAPWGLFWGLPPLILARRWCRSGGCFPLASGCCPLPRWFKIYMQTGWV